MKRSLPRCFLVVLTNEEEKSDFINEAYSTLNIHVTFRISHYFTFGVLLNNYFGNIVTNSLAGWQHLPKTAVY